MQKVESADLLMERVTQEDYERFLRETGRIVVEEVEIPLKGRTAPTMFGPPVDYKLEGTTVWSFPERGDWATHDGKYRGNWSPYIPRNLILKYSSPGDLVLDPMCGSGTTLVEAKLLGREAVGVDASREALMLTADRLNFQRERPDDGAKTKVRLYRGDARHMDAITNDSVDLVAMHPPYWGIISYSKLANPYDLSKARTLEEYAAGMGEVASEAYRVIKPGKYCAILIGDTRRHRHFVPISHRVLGAFLDSSFVLVEDIIKMQWKTKSTRERWGAEDFARHGFHMIHHEHLFIFRKLAAEEKAADYSNSAKWHA